MNSSRRRVVVTGLGIVSPLGCQIETFWKNLVAGKSGIRAMPEDVYVNEYSSRIAGQVDGFNPLDYFEPKAVRKMDPFVQYGLAAAMEAVKDAGLDMDRIDRDRFGAVASSGVGGLEEIKLASIALHEKGVRRLSPFLIPKMITNILAGEVAIRLGIHGPNFCVTSACASATHSLGDALRIIQYGDADLMLAGGAEAPLNPFGIGGFCAMKALCSDSNENPESGSRPFDATRSGFVIAEGAGMLVLEEYEHARKRGAPVYCELAGYGATCDAYHITAPNAEGTQAARGMALAAQDAGLNADEIQYINAHGTSTPLNDKTETAAIKRAFGEENARRMMVSSSKSMTGHMLGAAGGAEAIACALMLKHGVVTPTMNYAHPDPDCDLDYVPNEAREVELTAVLSNSLGFGGHNGTLAFKKL